MRDFAIVFVHLIVTLARLAGPGGLRSVVAESVLIRHQLLILNRGRKRAPNLRATDRIIAGLCALFMRPARVVRSAIVLKPSTLLHLHSVLRKRKYRMLFSPRHCRRPGPKGPNKDLIEAVVATKRRNPGWGCPRIAWTTADLEAKLIDFQHYYNGHRTHAGLEGRLPEPLAGGTASPAGLDSYRWRRHCRGLYQTPIAA